MPHRARRKKSGGQGYGRGESLLEVEGWGTPVAGG